MTEETFSAGEISFESKGRLIKLSVRGKYSADILIDSRGIRSAKPIEDTFQFQVEEFMDFMFAIYGIEERWKKSDGVRRIEVGRADDYFVKFTNFAKEQRTIFYLRGEERENLMVRLETIRGQLREIRFRHENVMVVYDWDELHFITDRESDVLHGYSLELFKEVIRDGLGSKTGFLSFGAGKISLNKPEGYVSIGGKVYKDRTRTDTFYLAEGVPIPKLTAKTYLAVR